jgi:hypothetical protein
MKENIKLFIYVNKNLNKYTDLLDGKFNIDKMSIQLIIPAIDAMPSQLNPIDLSKLDKVNRIYLEIKINF